MAGAAFDRRDLAGPFDIVGDVHGCADELEALLEQLGYRIAWSGKDVNVAAPPGRTLVFVGDLVDRGPRVPDVLRIAMTMAEQGAGLSVEGNHDNKFARWLKGANVKPGHGLQMSVDQMTAEDPAFKARVSAFLDTLPPYLWLDDGRLVVAHAGLRQEMIGEDSGKVRSFALYGDTTGGVDEDGYPIRGDWARSYAGKAVIVYGHVAAPMVEWVNNTICLDSGCCFGGRLTALRWPERELVSVPALRPYFEPRGRFATRTR